MRNEQCNDTVQTEGVYDFQSCCSPETFLSSAIAIAISIRYSKTQINAEEMKKLRLLSLPAATEEMRRYGKESVAALVFGRAIKIFPCLKKRLLWIPCHQQNWPWNHQLQRQTLCLLLCYNLQGCKIFNCVKHDENTATRRVFRRCQLKEVENGKRCPLCCQLVFFFTRAVFSSWSNLTQRLSCVTRAYRDFFFSSRQLKEQLKILQLSCNCVKHDGNTALQLLLLTENGKRCQLKELTEIFFLFTSNFVVVSLLSSPEVILPG